MTVLLCRMISVISKKLIDGNDFSYFDDQDFATKSFNELLSLAQYQGKLETFLFK